MLITWFGQSAFRITGDGPKVVIDPHGATESLAARGMHFEYRSMDGVEADVLLITHEHVDHNGVEKVAGEPQVFRSKAGTFESATGTITAIASEHDDQAGTLRGSNVIFVFEYEGQRICHLGDLGQARLRDEQLQLIGSPDILFIPVGGGITIGSTKATALISQVSPRIVIPMHYRTDAIDFLEPIDPFLDEVDSEIVRLKTNDWDSDSVQPGGPEPVVVVPSAPA